MSRLILLVVMMGLTAAMAQKDPVLMTVDGDPVLRSEFEAIFRKNYDKERVERKDLEEYIDLFVNFKLKVAEAERLGLDTVPKFENELEGYRKQLARPYLVDREMTDQLMREAYDRLQKEVRASHILVRVSPDANPEDSLMAWNRIMELRDTIVGGADFGEIAAMKGGSEDPSATSNKGDLGFFTAFQMVYPFESTAYKLKIGEVSKPIRTRYGYHIIKKTDEREARGKVKTAHIMIRTDKKFTDEQNENAHQRILEVYEKLQAGEDFASLAKRFSEDTKTAPKGGELPWFETGKMVMEFENAAFALENNGDYSEPIQTRFGWHIIKRIDHEPVGSFEELENFNKAKIQRDSRSELSRGSFIRKLKSEYKFKDKSKKLFPTLIEEMDTSVFQGDWSLDGLSNLDKLLFKYNKQKVTLREFAEFIQSTQRQQRSQSIDEYVRAKYDRYVEQLLIDLEESNLTKKYPEYKNLLKEYRDGILLFELTDQMVWSKAVEDTVGLKEFFEENREQFMWGKRYRGTILWFGNMSVAEQAQEMLQQDASIDSVRNTLNENSPLNVKIDRGTFEITKDEWLQSVDPNDKNFTPHEDAGKIGILVLEEVLEPAPKELDETRGPVIARYQDHLEEKWMKELKERYKVVVNEDVLYSIE